MRTLIIDSMIDRVSLLQYLQTWEGFSNPEGEINQITVRWQGTSRSQVVTVEIGEDNFSAYAAIANADEIGTEELGQSAPGLDIPEHFNLFLYEFWPPVFYWCLNFAADFADIESIERFRSEIILLANVCDILESSLSDEDKL